MSVDEIRQLLLRNPFEPFTIHRADARSFEVVNRDFLLLPRGRSTSIVFALPDGKFEWIYLKQITSIGSTRMIPAERESGGSSGD
ncbi:MAG TPA: hypothetical protein VK948_08325 [Aeromicrobium sp.]|nr:hypothetical protein [Aeromicrobium sp.]HSI35088.1 hypothetical protein [Tepidisphaeraceae bacterium]